MAIQEHIYIVRQGKAEWNAWKRTQPPTFVANLSKANLNGVNLSNVDFSRDNLSDADIRNADLSKANLSGANLSGANLKFADLSYTDLYNADLSGADLSGANLNRADLSGANLNTTQFSRANLREAHLNRARLSNTNLSYADLSQANIGLTIFEDVDLSMTTGLETIRHKFPSTIGINTIYKSQGKIPTVFLQGAGIPEPFLEVLKALINRPIEYYTCFISYSSKDELFVRRLHNDLQQEGVRCWFAPEDMDIGDKIKHRIDESIRMYDKLLLILSESSIKSTWVSYEVERALNKEPQGIPNVLYPIRVDKTILACTETWAQDIKGTRHIGNFEDWTNPKQYEESFKRLLRALNTKKDQQKK